MENFETGNNIPKDAAHQNTPYVYSPGSDSQPPATIKGQNIQVETKVDSFITVSLVIFGVIMLFIPYGFILAAIIFYCAFRTKKYRVVVDGDIKERKSHAHIRPGLIIFGVILVVLALFYTALINGLT